MRHISLKGLYEALLDDSEDVLVTAKSKRYALYNKSGDKSAHILGGDFSGSEEEREAEVRRIMKDAA